MIRTIRAKIGTGPQGLVLIQTSASELTEGVRLRFSRDGERFVQGKIDLIKQETAVGVLYYISMH
jgi:hypothetical protein